MTYIWSHSPAPHPTQLSRPSAVLAFVICLAMPASPQTVVNVPAAQPWTDTGIKVAADQRVTITATGKIYAGSLAFDPHDTPDGQSKVSSDGSTCIGGSGMGGRFLAPGLPCWSLVGRIGQSGIIFEVGSSKSFVADSSGELYLGVNDNFFPDNSGSWSAKISISGNTASAESLSLSISPNSVPVNGHATASGYVRDSSGKAVPGTQVVLYSSTNNYGTAWKTLTTTQDGSFSFLFAAPRSPGSMTVKAELATSPQTTASASLTISLADSCEDPFASLKSWSLAWSDEFNSNTVGPPDTSRWNFNLGSGTWGNGEVEVYCGPPSYQHNPKGCPTTFSTSSSNAYIDGKGHLVIQAIDNNGTWTSARMNTDTDPPTTFQYGVVAACMRLPDANGVGPAFWMMGVGDSTNTSWPYIGEMDIVEHWRRLGGISGIDAAVHGGVVGGPKCTGLCKLGLDLTDRGVNFDDFHLYGVKWLLQKVQFFVDDPDKPFLTLEPSDLPKGTWKLDDWPFYIILNVAVSGGPLSAWGQADSSASPARMLVDYVRVYKQQITTSPSTSAGTSHTITQSGIPIRPIPMRPQGSAAPASTLTEGRARTTTPQKEPRIQPQRPTDEIIIENINNRLRASLTLKSREILATCQKGIVTLAGTVNAADEKATAERIARSERGVQQVNNQLAISPTVVSNGTPTPSRTVGGTIRSVDFQNFNYASNCFGENGPAETVHVSKGQGNTQDEEFFADKPVYGDLKGDGQEEAVVVLSCHPSGMSPNVVSSEVFIFEMSESSPRILAKLPASYWKGERVSGARVANHQLAVEFLEIGNGPRACPEWIVTTTFRWNGSSFVSRGQSRRKNSCAQ